MNYDSFFMRNRAQCRSDIHTQGETSLAFLVHPTMTDPDVNDTITAVKKVMEHASS